MHPAELPAEIVERLRRRRGKLHPFDALEGQRTALALRAQRPGTELLRSRSMRSTAEVMELLRK